MSSKEPNEVLRQERKKRGWSQARVAEQIDTDAVNISRWERGYATPSPYFREKLCLLFEKNARDLGFLQDEQSREERQPLPFAPPSNPAPLQESSEHQQQCQNSEVPGHMARLLAVQSYLFGWVSGLLLFLLNRNRFVRFHSLQSLLFFSISNVLSLICLAFLVFLAFLKKTPTNNPTAISFIGMALLLFFALLNFFTFVVWIVGMFEAWQGRSYRLPFVGPLSENMLANRFRPWPADVGHGGRAVAKGIQS